MILPSWQYGDPADALDRLRQERINLKRQKDYLRKHKSRRIRALVKQVMKAVKR